MRVQFDKTLLEEGPEAKNIKSCKDKYLKAHGLCPYTNCKFHQKKDKTQDLISKAKNDGHLYAFNQDRHNEFID